MDDPSGAHADGASLHSADDASAAAVGGGTGTGGGATAGGSASSLEQQQQPSADSPQDPAAAAAVAADPDSAAAAATAASDLAGNSSAFAPPSLPSLVPSGAASGALPTPTLAGSASAGAPSPSPADLIASLNGLALSGAGSVSAASPSPAATGGGGGGDGGSAALAAAMAAQFQQQQAMAACLVSPPAAPALPPFFAAAAAMAAQQQQQQQQQQGALGDSGGSGALAAQQQLAAHFAAVAAAAGPHHHHHHIHPFGGAPAMSLPAPLPSEPSGAFTGAGLAGPLGSLGGPPPLAPASSAGLGAFAPSPGAGRVAAPRLYASGLAPGGGGGGGGLAGTMSLPAPISAPLAGGGMFRTQGSGAYGGAGGGGPYTGPPSTGPSARQTSAAVSAAAAAASTDAHIRRTVYVSSIDSAVTESLLAAFFADCGAIVDCRLCGDSNSGLRFAFVEFTDEAAVPRAMARTGAVLGSSALRVLPSKTAIVPVNRELMPRSAEDVARCARTVYVANVDRRVERAEVRAFFERRCGRVSALRLLGDQAHATRVAFVEFARPESALAALNCSGSVLGVLPLRVSPSKTPVRVSDHRGGGGGDRSGGGGSGSGSGAGLGDGFGGAPARSGSGRFFTGGSASGGGLGGGLGPGSGPGAGTGGSSSGGGSNSARWVPSR
jgi:hypothetical protein